MQLPKQLLTAFTLAALSASVWAQSQSASSPSPNTTTPITAADIQALKDAMAAQQKQIQALEERLKLQNQAAEKAQTAASDAAAKADSAQAQATQLRTDVATLKNVSGTQGNANLQPAVMTVQDQQQPSTDQAQTFNKDMEGPLTIHFRGINITPGGFVAAEFVRRSRALGTDVSTPYNSIPMPGASQSNLPEFFATARQSRPTVFFAAREGRVDFSGYVSSDFLSSGTTSTATQTNSYTLRIRQAWAQAKFGSGWSILGGQMWSLVTENKFEIGPADDTGRSNDARPSTIDSQYSVGFTYARQAAIRLTKSFNDKVSIAFAVENPQATVTSHGNTNNYLLVQSGASSNLNSLATYGFNPSPDLIAKVAFDPGFGHYEVFGLYNRFTNRIFPCENFFISTATPPVTTILPTCPSTTDAGTTAAAYNTSKNGGGVGANARWTFANKHIVFGLHGFGGSGVGRYGAAQLSDVAINADGTIRLIKNLQGLATLEFHTKKLDIYSYLGSEYDQRAYSFDPVQTVANGANTFVGYGSPTFSNSGCYLETAPASGPLAGSLSKCTADTRAVTEGTLGFWYKFYTGPRGTFRWGTQYSYVNRAAWSGKGGTPTGIDNMVFTSFRYYLP